MGHEHVSILLQAAGIAQGSVEDQLMPQAEQESHPPAAMPAQMPESGLHTAPGMQPQGQPSSFGMAEAGRGGAPQPVTAEQAAAGRGGEAEMQEANPFRSGSGPASAAACPAWALCTAPIHQQLCAASSLFKICQKSPALAAKFLNNKCSKSV